MMKKKTILSAILLVLGLVIVTGVALLIQKGNFSDQSQAATNIRLGKLIAATDTTSCTKCVQQCPGGDNVLRNCNPMESDGTSKDSTCDRAGRVEFCGNQTFCCPKAGLKWTTDLKKCADTPIIPKTPYSYKLLKAGGYCTALVVSKTLAAPLLGKEVVATGTLKEPYFYATQLVLNKCVQQCPGTDNVLRSCTPPESDGTSNDSLCNVTGRKASCGGVTFCCPKAGGPWTKDLTKCAATPTPTKTSCIQQCPGVDKVLRNCTPPEADGTPQESLCNTKGRIESCGGVKFCCPSVGSQWTKELYKCTAPNCVQQCPGTDNILRSCTPPEADGTSNDSQCNVKGRIEVCGNVKFCCPAVGALWTKDLTKCP